MARVCREEMEKVNIVFHDNYTVSYQHKKVLQFVPEMSLDKNLRIITPNIPLLVSVDMHDDGSFQYIDYKYPIFCYRHCPVRRAISASSSRAASR